jgi:RNA polymerase primary sigma factor
MNDEIIQWFRMLRELGLVFSELSPREQKVLEMRFGVKLEGTKTLEDVGKEFGVTRERIRQIETKAMYILESKLSEKRIKELK